MGGGSRTVIAVALVIAVVQVPSLAWQLLHATGMTKNQKPKNKKTKKHHGLGGSLPRKIATLGVGA